MIDICQLRRDQIAGIQAHQRQIVRRLRLKASRRILQNRVAENFALNRGRSMIRARATAGLLALFMTVTEAAASALV